LGNLSEKLRAVVVLRFFWELSHVEISQVLSIPVGTVKSRLDLALRTLRKELDTTAEDAARHGASFQKEVSR
ncbi:MAG TPA: sigma factor-like helix-turn-helix DNA-binding protein, partial [Dehalococcoidia bacterium]|nr:sigma factor-like helix-turn-helix DNA-binding protein [Dehalococcoidia bacterium]